MSDYTPPTEQVREIYAEIRHEYTGFGFDTHRSEFDRWLEQVKAEAWEEGFDAGQDDAFDLDTHPDHTCIPNPYRQEKDA